MLIQFSFKNYKSFRDETILDLTATRETELSFHVREVSGEKILPVAIIYGANASGKSNVIEALKWMRSFVLSSLNYGEETKEERYYRPMPFFLDNKSIQEPTSFEVYFTLPDDDRVFNYGFSLDKEGVVEEWFNQKSRTGRKYSPVFYRTRSEIDLSGIEAKHRDNLRVALSGKTLLVSLGAKLNVERLKPVFSFFVNSDITNFGDPLENTRLSKMTPYHFSDDESVRKSVVKFLSSFDESIVDFRVEEAIDQKGAINIDAGHRMNDSENIVFIPFEEESAGTRKMFALYPFIKRMLETGGTLFVDELNARLHPLLVRTLVQMFVDPSVNTNNAQLIFTAHDSWQLYNGTFRRDEIWFTEKKKDGTSSLYSLADFILKEGTSVRWDTNFQKNYLLGKYGAIPSMKPFDLSNGKRRES